MINELIDIDYRYWLINWSILINEINWLIDFSILKFLDSQRIEQLTEYLEALHKTDVANYDHTTILLNCYTKLSDSAKIEKFLKVILKNQ